MQQPLKNKTILITRSKAQSKDFANQLKRLGAKTIILPLIETKSINQQELTNKLNHNNYHWIIFTSPNAVSFFFEIINGKNISSKIAAVGSKTAKLLKKKGINIDFIPTQFTSKCLANEIPLLKNDSILIPRSNLAKNDLVTILENRNYKVESLPIYENTIVKYSKPELAIIFNQKIDFITFTSGSTVNSFMRLGIKINHEKIVCIGPETKKVAAHHNLIIAGVADPHTIEGMVEKILFIAKQKAIE